jgi:hypothetical protein
MPMPGSQKSNTIELAYFLGSNKNIIRLIGYLLLLYPLFYLFKNGVKKEKAVVAIFIFYLYIYLLRFYLSDGS